MDSLPSVKRAFKTLTDSPRVSCRSQLTGALQKGRADKSATARTSGLALAGFRFLCSQPRLASVLPGSSMSSRLLMAETPFQPGSHRTRLRPDWRCSAAIRGSSLGCSGEMEAEVHRAGTGDPSHHPREPGSPKLLCQRPAFRSQSHTAGCMSERPLRMGPGRCVRRKGPSLPPCPFGAAHVIPILSLLTFPVGVGMKLTDVGIATLAKG